jgi:hypothetical protein
MDLVRQLQKPNRRRQIAEKEACRSRTIQKIPGRYKITNDKNRASKA